MKIPVTTLEYRLYTLIVRKAPWILPTNLGRLYLNICRINGTWLAAYLVAAATGTWMFPDKYHVDSWAPLIPVAVGLSLFTVYRDGFVSRPKRDEFLLISVEGYQKKLKQWIDTLIHNRWIQGSGLSFMETLLFVFMSIGPAAALFRWTSGAPLARDPNWLSVLVRMLGVGIVMWMWPYVKQANRDAAGILTDEFKRVPFSEAGSLPS